MIARVSNLHKTESEWQNHPEFIPNAGELVIYDPDDQYKYARFKVGDGETLLKDLEFFLEATIADLLKNSSFNSTIDSGRITNYK